MFAFLVPSLSPSVTPGSISEFRLFDCGLLPNPSSVNPVPGLASGLLRFVGSSRNIAFGRHRTGGVFDSPLPELGVPLLDRWFFSRRGDC